MNALNWIQFGIELVMFMYMTQLINQRHMLEQMLAETAWRDVREYREE